MDKEHFVFEISGIAFRIVLKKGDFFLESPDIKEKSVRLLLPTPGTSDTSTATSTYDEKSEKTVNFKLAQKEGSRAVIRADILTKTYYWCYGSFDDDWHPKDTEHEAIRLIVKLIGKSDFEVTYPEKSRP